MYLMKLLNTDISVLKLPDNNSLVHKHAFAALMASTAVFSHFSAMAYDKSESPSHALVVYQFLDLDTDHDNKLSKTEAMRDWDISANFKKADFNNDGLLALNEYTNFKAALKNAKNARHAQAPGNGLVVNNRVVTG